MEINIIYLIMLQKLNKIMHIIFLEECLVAEANWYKLILKNVPL